MDYMSLTEEQRQEELRKIPIGANITEEQRDHLRKVDHMVKDTDKMAEHYARFLHDGDFEEFITVPFMDKKSDDYLKMKIRLLEEEIRLLWIQARFLQFWSKEWAQNKSIYMSKHSYLRLFKGEIEKRETGKYTMQEANEL